MMSTARRTTVTIASVYTATITVAIRIVVNEFKYAKLLGQNNYHYLLAYARWQHKNKYTAVKNENIHKALSKENN